MACSMGYEGLGKMDQTDILKSVNGTIMDE